MSRSASARRSTAPTTRDQRREARLSPCGVRRVRLRRVRSLEDLEDRTLLTVNPFAGSQGIAAQLDGLLKNLQTQLDSVVSSSPIPFLGKTLGNLDAVQFITKTLVPKLDSALQALEADPNTQPSATTIQTEIFSLLGNGPGGLDLIANLNGNTVKGPADIIVTP